MNKKLKAAREVIEKWLCNFGGFRLAEVRTGWPEDLERVVKCYRVFELPKRKIKLSLGCPNNCHSNAPMLADVNPHLEVWTGFALTSEDGIWRHHSWCVDPPFGIVETTEKRKVYVGARLPIKLWKKRLGGVKGRKNFYLEWSMKEELNRCLNENL